MPPVERGEDPRKRREEILKRARSAKLEYQRRALRGGQFEILAEHDQPPDHDEIPQEGPPGAKPRTRGLRRIWDLVETCFRVHRTARTRR